jgi:DNA polymerase-3 subunit beta
MTLFATDKYRLAIRELTWEPEDPEAGVRALIPARTLADAAKTFTTLGGPVTVALSHGDSGEGMIGFAGGVRMTTTRLLDNTFPNVRSLLTEHAFTCQVSIPEMREKVKRVALVADRMRPIGLTFEADSLTVEAGFSSDTQAKEVIKCAYDGEPMEVGFNSTFLVDGLMSMNAPTLRLGLDAPGRSTTLMPADEDGKVIPGYRYILMPMRVPR